MKGNENPVDMFTKNLAGLAFNKFSWLFVGDNEYNSKNITITSKQGILLDRDN